MGMIAYLVQVTTLVMVKMLTFLQIGLDLAGVLCFVSFESMDHMLLHFPLFFSDHAVLNCVFFWCP